MTKYLLYVRILFRTHADMNKKCSLDPHLCWSSSNMAVLHMTSLPTSLLHNSKRHWRRRTSDRQWPPAPSNGLGSFLPKIPTEMEKKLGIKIEMHMKRNNNKHSYDMQIYKHSYYIHMIWNKHVNRTEMHFCILFLLIFLTFKIFGEGKIFNVFERSLLFSSRLQG